MYVSLDLLYHKRKVFCGISWLSWQLTHQCIVLGGVFLVSRKQVSEVGKQTSHSLFKMLAVIQLTAQLRINKETHTTRHFVLYQHLHSLIVTRVSLAELVHNIGSVKSDGKDPNI